MDASQSDGWGQGNTSQVFSRGASEVLAKSGSGLESLSSGRKSPEELETENLEDDDEESCYGKMMKETQGDEVSSQHG